MKKILFIFLSFLFTLTVSHAQYYVQYFDGADTNIWNSVFIELDTNAENIWQIGEPQKSIFDAASTIPNVLITDTINTYPDSLASWAWFDIPSNALFAGGLAIQWNQKIDFDFKKDGGLVEFSSDSGITWQNAFTSTDVYMFYGWNLANKDTLQTGEYCFTGTDSTWKNVWLCFMYDYLWTINNLRVRYTIISDSIETNQEGWMIDNLMVAETWFHPVNEQSKYKNFKVYPTITDQRINVEQLNHSPDYKVHTLYLIDATGKIVKTVLAPNSLEYIDVSDLAPGNYFLKIESNIKKEMHSIIISR